MRVLEGLAIVLILVALFGIMFLGACLAVALDEDEDEIAQYTHIVVDDTQYVIADLSDIWQRTDFIEFTTKDGSRIHAATYELRK